MFRMISVTSSFTPGIVENSCWMPSIWMLVTAAPCRGGQHAAQSIAKRMAVATLRRLYRKPAIELILAAAAFDTGILNIYHHSFSSSSC